MKTRAQADLFQLTPTDAADPGPRRPAARISAPRVSPGAQAASLGPTPIEPSARSDTHWSVRPEDLPESARAIVEVIGLTAMLRLIEALGGCKFPVPQQPRPGTQRYDTLRRAVGEAAAERLIRQYAGEELYIPSCSAALRTARDRAIIADYTAGTSVWDLARQYRVSERTVYLALKRPLPL